MTASPAPHTPSRTRNRVVLAAASVVAAVALGFGGLAATNAWFTSEASVAGQDVSTATVKISAGVNSAASPISIGSMLPGDIATTTIDVINDGTEDVYYAIGPFVTTGDAALADSLQVTVSEYSGVRPGSSTTHSLTEWRSGQYEGITLEAGATSSVTVAVELPTTADDSLQGTTAGFTIEFSAIQARNFGGTSTPTWVSAE